MSSGILFGLWFTQLLAVAYICSGEYLQLWKSPTDADDGFPICFSWPVLLTSVKREYRLYKRLDGVEFNPKCISSIPNVEYNERHCLVIFDVFIIRNNTNRRWIFVNDPTRNCWSHQTCWTRWTCEYLQGLTLTNPWNQSGPVFLGARMDGPSS